MSLLYLLLTVNVISPFLSLFITLQFTALSSSFLPFFAIANLPSVSYASFFFLKTHVCLWCWRDPKIFWLDWRQTRRIWKDFLTSMSKSIRSKYKRNKEQKCAMHGISQENATRPAPLKKNRLLIRNLNS